ncbi:MAG: S24/S26 family peptidase [Lachnospiraceae bacterium]|nr:S24/S26 family peptidase [Lachnospiraceae bacterium]
MKLVDTLEYVSMLRELTQQGKEVSMTISGNSMNPFLIHQRDMIFFKKPDRKLKKGDMVFYERDNGQFVMHRICRVCKNGYDIVGDAQTQIERGIREEQIFAIVTKVRRKDRIIAPGDFWWEFFEHIWINLIPIRRFLMRLYGMIK